MGVFLRRGGDRGQGERAARVAAAGENPSAQHAHTSAARFSILFLSFCETGLLLDETTLISLVFAPVLADEPAVLGWLVWAAARWTPPAPAQGDVN